MSVLDLITKINKEIPLAYFEMEYDYEVSPDYIDLRLYGANIVGAETIKNIIIDFDFNGVTSVQAEEPVPTEFEAFSGYEFVRVWIGVDRNVARSHKDRFFFNDAGRML